MSRTQDSAISAHAPKVKTAGKPGGSMHERGSVSWARISSLAGKCATLRTMVGSEVAGRPVSTAAATSCLIVPEYLQPGLRWSRPAGKSGQRPGIAPSAFLNKPICRVVEQAATCLPCAAKGGSVASRARQKAACLERILSISSARVRHRGRRLACTPRSGSSTRWINGKSGSRRGERAFPWRLH